ncbi:lysozyme 2-like [Maniola jurtina]|uniref:lysozyme 2-like n=1 Tax=Maniola jurtina TaxID=191418 RepID=UPI001E68B63B|nr:lysozyme 2-like [Maniola jurtina]
MYTKVLLGISFAMILLFKDVTGIFIPNLNDTCLRCLCHVAGCDLSHRCTDGYCGPFYISRIYWVDAGKPTLVNDTPDRKEAYEDCARDYDCSKHIVVGYMAKFGKDCNDDGVTDCFDYVMINHNGGWGCSAPLNSTSEGRRRLELFQQCRLQ